MEEKLATITPERWELIRERRNALMIDLGRDDWLFELAPLYQKGEVEIYLCPVPTRRKKVSLLKPLTDKEWAFATKRAEEILSQLGVAPLVSHYFEQTDRARSPEFPDKHQDGFHDHESGEGGELDG